MSRSLLGPAGLVWGALGLLGLWLLAVPATDPDFGWHVANGRHVLDGVLFAARDVYSWTAPGATWIAHEWGSEWVMAGLEDSLGPTAVSLAAALMALAGLGLVGSRLVGRGFSLASAAGATLLALLTCLVSATTRPLVMEVFGLGASLWLWQAYRDGRLSDRRLAVAAGLLMLLWANTHGSYPLEVAVWLAGAAESFVGGRRRRAARLVALSGVCAIVACLNPFGPRLWAYSIEALQGSRLDLIQEWASPDFRASEWWPLLLLIVLALGGTVVILHRARADGLTSLSPWVADVGLAGVGILAALHSGRHVIIAAPTAAPLVATALTAAQSRWKRSEAAGSEVHPRLNLALLVLGGLLTVGALWLKVGPIAQTTAREATYPVAALPALDVAVCADGPRLDLLNEFGWGGYLTQVRPGARIFIDGRVEVYGDAQVARYALLMAAAPGWQEALDGVGVQTALIRADSALAPALRQAGWITRYADDLATLLVRPGSPAADPPARCAAASGAQAPARATSG
ncbi:MAG TPA: hypothetical protein VFW92_09465 [Candidatus Limnocylindrales bacterium]|nr:hypothetical protein [Candidatus Limnocylindrales bacterium]